MYNNVTYGVIYRSNENRFLLKLHNYVNFKVRTKDTALCDLLCTLLTDKYLYNQKIDKNFHTSKIMKVVP